MLNLRIIDNSRELPQLRGEIAMAKKTEDGTVNPDNVLSQTEQETQKKTGSYRHEGLRRLMKAFNEVVSDGGFGPEMQKAIVNRPVHLKPLRDEAGKHVQRKLAWIFTLKYWAYIPPDFTDPNSEPQWKWQEIEGDAVTLYAAIASYNSYRAVRMHTIDEELAEAEKDKTRLQLELKHAEALLTKLKSEKKNIDAGLE